MLEMLIKLGLWTLSSLHINIVSFFDSHFNMLLPASGILISVLLLNTFKRIKLVSLIILPAQNILCIVNFKSLILMPSINSAINLLLYLLAVLFNQDTLIMHVLVVRLSLIVLPVYNNINTISLILLQIVIFLLGMIHSFSFHFRMLDNSLFLSLVNGWSILFSSNVFVGQSVLQRVHVLLVLLLIHFNFLLMR